MVKLLLSSVCLGLIGLTAVTPVYAQISEADLEFEEALKALTTPAKVEYVKRAEKPEEIVIPVQDNRYKTELMNAVMFHNLMNSIKAQYSQLDGFRMAVLDKEVSNERVKDFDSCNVTMLTPYFANPKQVWDKLKAATDEHVENYNLETVASAEELMEDDAALLASASDAQKELQEKQGNLKLTKNAQSQMAHMIDEYKIDVTKAEGVEVQVKNESAAETAAAEADWETNENVNVGELAPEVDITFAVLNQFYARQDEWGKRKSETTSSLPLWEDQKYLYNRDIWKPKYRQIQQHCAAQEHPLVQKEAKVSDKIKYDYYFYDDVKSAHNAFVKAAQAQECVLTAQMKEPPKVAPRPLPPVYEEIVVIKDESDNLQEIYPQNPMNPSASQLEAFKKGTSWGIMKNDEYEGMALVASQQAIFEKGTLWEKYKADEYKGMASAGEFKQYFAVSGNTLRARSKVDEINGNRLSRYLEYKEDAANALETYDGYLDAAQELALSLEEAAELNKIDLPKNLNYLDKKDLDKVYKLFKAEKEKALSAVEKDLGPKVANVSSMTAEELQKDAVLAYYKALITDKDAEVKLTEEKALTIDEAIEESRANQKLIDLMNETANQDKLDKIQGSKVYDGKNYKADTSNCLEQTKTRLLDINKVQIK